MRIAQITRSISPWLLAIMMFVSSAWAIVRAAEADFLEPEKAFVVTATIESPQTVRLNFAIAKNYYMYRSRFSFAIEPDSVQQSVQLGEPNFPAGKIKHDPTFNQDMELYFNELPIRLPIAAWPKGTTPVPFTLKVTGQGCATAGLCYPPMDFLIKLTAAPDLTTYVVLDHLDNAAANNWKSGR